MKFLRYGKFLDSAPVEDYYDWDTMPIGMHNMSRRADERNYKTAHNEFYYKDKDNKIHIVRDAHPILKMLAMLRFRNPNKIAGYVNTSYIDKPKQKADKPAKEQEEIEL